MTFPRVISGLAFTAVLLTICVLPTFAAEYAQPTLGEEEADAGEAAVEAIDKAIDDAIHGKAGAHGKTDSNPLEFREDLAIWTLIVFLILLGVLWKFAWKPITEGLDKREKGIADRVEGAEKANQQAQELLAQYEQKLVDTKDEVRKIIEQGHRNAEKVRQELIEKAKKDADEERQRGLHDIDTATAGALRDLAEKSADLAVDLAGKIVRAELKPADHSQLIERAMSDFGAQPPSNN